MKKNNENTSDEEEIYVDSNNPLDIEFLHRQFPKKTHEEIRNAIKNKGPLRNHIIQFLRREEIE